MTMSQVVLFVVQFAASIFLARLLTPRETGIYAIALAVTGVLSILQAAGLNGFVVREPQMSPSLMRSAFTMNALLSMGLAVLLAVASIAAGHFLQSNGVRKVMLVLIFIPLLGIFEFLPATNIERAAGFEIIALISGGKVLVAQTLSVALAFLHFSYMSIAYGQIAGAIFSAVVFNLAGRQHVSFRPSLAAWRRIMKFGLQMLAISGVNGIGSRLCDIGLGRIVGFSALGLYQRAGGLNNMIQANIYMVIVRVLFVDMAATVRAGKSLRLSYLATIDILTALLWPAFAGLAVLGGPLIHYVYGPRWQAAALPLSLLSISSMASVMVALSWEIFVVKRETARQARIAVVTSTVDLTLFLTGCHFGLVGAALARIPGALFYVVVYWPHMNRMTDTKAGDFVGIYARSAALTALAVAPAVALMTAHHWNADIPILSALASIFGGIGLWFTGLHFTRHQLASELRILINRRRRLPAPQ